MSKKVQKWATSTRATFASLPGDKKASLMRELNWSAYGDEHIIEPRETTPLVAKVKPWWTTLPCFGGRSAPPQKAKKRHGKKPASKALAEGLKDMVGMGDDPENSQWVGSEPLGSKRGARKDEHCCGCLSKVFCCCCGKSCAEKDGADKDNIANIGAMLVSIEAVPMRIATMPGYQAGDGRNEPNQNPKLPPPSGRIDPTQLMNPFFLLGTLVGPEVAAELCCCFGCMFFLAAIVCVGPLALEMTQLALMLPNATGLYLMVTVVAAACCACSYIFGKLYSCCGSEPPKEEESDDGDFEMG